MPHSPNALNEMENRSNTARGTVCGTTYLNRHSDRPYCYKLVLDNVVLLSFHLKPFPVHLQIDLLEVLLRICCSITQEESDSHEIKGHCARK